jgi:GAF domain-containing protein
MPQIAAPELRSLLDAVNAAGDAEAALALIGHAAIAALGDKAAGSRPGALKPGETERTIFGFLLVKPKRDGLMLFAEHGWPAEQHRASIAIDNGRPGWVVAHGKAAALPNTDEDAIFTQILSSARMGSTIYAPLIWRGETIGLITLASQARYTYSAAEIPALEALAGIAALAWVAHGGPALLARECGV